MFCLFDNVYIIQFHAFEGRTNKAPPITNSSFTAVNYLTQGSISGTAQQVSPKHE